MSGHKLGDVHLQLARIYEQRGHRAKAAAELEEYLKKSPEVKNAQVICDAIKKLKAAP